MGSEAGAVAQRLGWGYEGWAAPFPCRASPQGQGLRKGMASSAGDTAKGPQDKWGGCLQRHSVTPSLTSASPRGKGGLGDCVPAQSLGKGEGEQERGHRPRPHPLSPRQLARPGPSVPSVLSWPPGVWAVLTSLLGRAAG